MKKSTSALSGCVVWLISMGVFALMGLVISGVLAFALAAPAAVLIGRLLNRRQKPAFAPNIEPE